MLPEEDGLSSNCYGFLLSVSVCCRSAVENGQIESLAEIQRGVVGSETLGGTPQVQGVSVPAAFEAVKHVLGRVGREAASCTAAGSVEGAGTTQL